MAVTSSQREVILVSMPWTVTQAPSIQLGIVKGLLDRAGIACDTAHLYLAFFNTIAARLRGRRISLDRYESFGESFGEWVFSVPPFRQPHDDSDRRFRDLMIREHAREWIEHAFRVRELVPAFLAECADEILLRRPKVVGFSSTFHQNVASLALSRLLKQHDPALAIVFGGANCEGKMGAGLHRMFPWIDVVVRGEAERVAPRLFSELVIGGVISPQSGLFVRQHGEIQIHEEDREIDVLPSQAAPRQQHSECGPETAATAVHVLRIGNPAAARTPVGPVTMDDVPLPVYDEYFARLAHSPLEKQLDRVWVPYESSRGCWWAVKKVCTFCAANAQYVTFRSRAPARVAADVEQLAQRYGTRYVWFVDNIMDERYLREVFPRMPGARDRLSMFVETRAHVSRAQLEKMRDAGVEIVQLGVESFSSPILRLIDKGTTGLQNIRVIKWCAELGIQAFYNVIYGFPGEPPDEYERMANLVPALSHLEPPKDPVPLRLDRYSPYHRDPDRYGIEVTGVRPSRPLVFDRDPSELEDIEYFFTFGYRDRREPNRYAARFIEACRMWRAGWRRDGATLTWGNSSAGMQICDRRRVVVPIHYDLATAESAIYRACDAGATAAAAHAALFPADQRDITVREVEAFLVRLVGLRLMYREGSRFLALAVSHPNISMSQASDGESPNSGSVVPLRLMTLPEVRQCHEEHGR